MGALVYGTMLWISVHLTARSGSLDRCRWAWVRRVNVIVCSPCFTLYCFDVLGATFCYLRPVPTEQMHFWTFFFKCKWKCRTIENSPAPSLAIRRCFCWSVQSSTQNKQKLLYWFVLNSQFHFVLHNALFVFFFCRFRNDFFVSAVWRKPTAVIPFYTKCDTYTCNRRSSSTKDTRKFWTTIRQPSDEENQWSTHTKRWLLC